MILSPMTQRLRFSIAFLLATVLGVAQSMEQIQKDYPFLILEKNNITLVITSDKIEDSYPELTVVF